MANGQIYILKGRFKALDTNTFGLFTVFLDKSRRSIEKMTVAVSHFSSLYEMNPEQDWFKFDQHIQQVRYRGEVSQNLTADFQSLFHSSFGPEVVETFLDAVEGKSLQKAEHVFVSVIGKALQDKALTVQLEKQTVSREEMERTKAEAAASASVSASAPSQAPAPAKAEPEPAQDTTFAVEDGAVILNVDLVIGPIGGIPIFELKPLDRIYVKIPGRTPKEMTFVNLLNARNESGEILPVPATVKEVRRDKGAKQVEILVEIVPGVYGKATEQESVKLKRYDPAADQRLKRTAGAAVPGAMPTVGPVYGPPASRSNLIVFLWVIGAVVLVIGLLVIFISGMR